MRVTLTANIQFCCHILPFVTSFKPVLGGTNIPFAVKKETQAISNTLEGKISENVPKLHEVLNLTVQTHAVSVFYQVSPATMAQTQTKDSVLGLVISFIHKGENQREQSFLKLNAKQYTSTCFSLINWY